MSEPVEGKVTTKTFFCENCGKPVALKAPKCPSCGRLFDAVKCPKCSFTGKESLFSNGCPSCGYLSRGDTRKADEKGAFAYIESGLVSPEHDGEGLEYNERGRGSRTYQGADARSGLPKWAYTAIIVGLGCLLITLLAVYLTM